MSNVIDFPTKPQPTEVELQATQIGEQATLIELQMLEIQKLQRLMEEKDI